MLSQASALIKRFLGLNSPDAQGKLIVNLGCGKVLHSAWRNMDLSPGTPGIEFIDLSRPLPFVEHSLRAVYCSHVLEHLPRGRVPRFLAECARVLRPNGILRLVVPDLEAAVREYLLQLEGAIRGEPGAEERHEWMMVELLDQLTRRVSGGFMARWWRSHPLAARELIEKRLGGEAMEWIERFEEESKSGRRLLTHTEIFELEDPTKKAALQFNRRGEMHRWMYDRVSLSRHLREAGFRDVQVHQADTSSIEDFVAYHLDADEQGKVRKPDSLFIEAKA